MTDDQKKEANRRISAAVVALKRMPTQTTGHMDDDERGAAVGQMLADLYTLAANDGCVSAGWAYEFACEVAEKSARVTAERDKLRAALEAVAKVTGKYGGQMSDLFGHDEEFNDAFDTVDAVLAETHNPQPEN